jgi:hypothetical protein
MAAFAFRIPITSRIHRRRRMRRLSGDDDLRTARNVDGRAAVKLGGCLEPKKTARFL